MKKTSLQNSIQKLRDTTPLWLRQRIGPALSQIFYIYRIHVNKNHRRPHVLSIKATIDKMVKEKVSVIRFGDGEISLIDGIDLPFQKRSETLVKRLEEIIKTDADGLLVCIPNIWGRLDMFKKYARDFNMHHVYRYDHVWKQLLIKGKTYGDTNVTRHYLAFNDRSNAGKYFEEIRSIWNGKDVLLIEGEKSRLGVGNNLFENVSSIKRILCPPENAFERYDEIMKKALLADKNSLILISLGPTAKVLAYDLFKAGYRVIDIGHIDMEYEMFLRNEDKQVRVPHKYFNEINERNPENCNDEKYKSEIITTIK